MYSFVWNELNFDNTYIHTISISRSEVIFNILCMLYPLIHYVRYAKYVRSVDHMCMLCSDQHIAMYPSSTNVLLSCQMVSQTYMYPLSCNMYFYTYTHFCTHMEYIHALNIC